MPTTANNLQASWVFAEIGDLLEIKGESPFKVRAYRQAARVLENLRQDVAALAAEEKLEEIPGIGKALAKKIREILETGSCRYLEELKKEVPAGLREMLAIPGLGPKSIRTIHAHLGITSLEALEEAAKEAKIRKLPGLGAKTELKILEGIALLKQQAGRVPLAVAEKLAAGLASGIGALRSTQEVAISGEVRRGEEMVGKVTLLVATSSPEEAFSLLERHPQVGKVEVKTRGVFRARTPLGVALEVRSFPLFLFPWAQLLFTGSPSHLKQLKAHAGKLKDLRGAKSEEEIYRRLGMSFVPPEVREGKEEVARALRGEIPALLQEVEIKGEFHVHSRWSDGLNSLEEIAEAALLRGYSYLGIADHSRSLAVAGGLSPEELLRQREEIERVKASFPGLLLLQGVEVEILPDGTLDYPPEVLASLDFVIAAVHTAFHQEEAQMTARLEAALKNPFVDILAHPTGRILGKRPPYALNLKRLFKAAAKEAKLLEINAAPDRLDLSAPLICTAKEEGVQFVINTDAHDTGSLADISYGVTTARRGWLTAKEVFNTKSKEEVAAWVEERRAYKKKLLP